MSTKKTKNNAQPVKRGKKETTQTERQSSAPAAKGGKARKAKKNDKDAISPIRLKMVELATQLVCAQIAASASYQVTLGLAQGQRGMIKELIDLFDNKEIEKKDIFDKICGHSMIPISEPPVLRPLSNVEHNQLFESAMFRAQWMLRSPERDYQVVYAEQMFGPDETLPEYQIGVRFGEYGWPNLTGRDSVIALMTNVDSLFRSHYESMNTALSSEKILRKGGERQKQIDTLLSALDFCREVSKNRFDRQRSSFRQAADSIENLITTLNHEGIYSIAPYFGSNYHRGLIVHMYNDSEPKPRKTNDAEESSSDNPKSPPRIYRPWGIFRYLRLYGETYESFDGKALNVKLRTVRCHLKPDKVLNHRRVKPEEYNFGPISDFVEKTYLPDLTEVWECGDAAVEMDAELNGPPVGY